MGRGALGVTGGVCRRGVEQNQEGARNLPWSSRVHVMAKGKNCPYWGGRVYPASERGKRGGKEGKRKKERNGTTPGISSHRVTRALSVRTASSTSRTFSDTLPSGVRVRLERDKAEMSNLEERPSTEGCAATAENLSGKGGGQSMRKRVRRL